MYSFSGSFFFFFLNSSLSYWNIITNISSCQMLPPPPSGCKDAQTERKCTSHWFFSSTGHRPARLCHGLLSLVRPSVRAVTFSLNIFFSETTYQILMKFHRNVPAMVLFRISWKNLIPSKTVIAMATKLKKKMKTLKIFLSETIRVKATKFGM